MKLLGKISSYDKIVAFMTNELEESKLTEHEQQMCIRWNEAWTLCRKFMSTADAAAILMKRFPGLSRAQAYRDCANAESLFGDIRQTKKEGIRNLVTEMLKDHYSTAKKMGELSEMRLSAVSIAKVNAVNVNDPDTFDWEKLEPHTYVLGIDPQMIQALKSMISGGKIDLTNMVDAMNSMATDAVIVSETEPDGAA